MRSELVSLEAVAHRLGLEPFGSEGWFNGPCHREGCEGEDDSFYLYPPGVITVTAVVFLVRRRT